jgi:hypothetical protein
MGLKHLLVASAAVLALNAQASSADWGAHGPLEVGVSLVSPGDINDTFTFTLSQPSSLVSTAVSNNLGALLQIDNGVVKLYKEAGKEDTFLGSFEFDGTTGSTSHAFVTDGPGTYYYSVVGQATGSSGGYYSITSSAGPVPEPTTMALTLAGLASAGMMYRRRVRS